MIDTPRGVKALLFQEAALKERIERKVLALFESWGFQRVETPAIEFLSELSKGLDEEGLRRIITFTDPAGGGKPLALRSDVTPQIARIAATSLAGRPVPLRLCYAQTVYRSVRPGAGARMEVSQAGVELIGPGAPEADAEMIAIAIESLRAVGFDQIKVAVSHIGYIKSTIAAAGLSSEDEASIRKALTRKDPARISAVLDKAGAEGEARRAIEALPSLFGGYETLDKAPLVNEKAAESISNLRDVLAVVERYGLAGMVTVDLGESRGFGYYTGVTFEGFAKGVGKRALSGGRYDNLLAEYGAGRPAIGFALDTDRVLDHFHRAGEPSGWSAADALVVGVSGSFMEAADLARRLRDRGFRVARDIVLRPLEESVEYARKMKITSVIVTGLEDTPSGSVRVITTATGRERNMAVAELLSSSPGIPRDL